MSEAKFLHIVAPPDCNARDLVVNPAHIAEMTQANVTRARKPGVSKGGVNIRTAGNLSSYHVKASLGVVMEAIESLILGDDPVVKIVCSEDW
jgi:hypothetical protein